MHLIKEPGFVIVLGTLRFPLQTITNAPFFETPVSPEAQEGQTSLFLTEEVS